MTTPCEKCVSPLTQGRRAKATHIALLLITLVLLGAWLIQRASVLSAASSSDSEIDQAIEATVKVVMAGTPPPQTMEELRQAVEVAFPILFPELAAKLNSKAPGVEQAEAEAIWRFENAAAVEAELMKDEQFRRRRAEALADLGRDIDPQAKRKAIAARHRLRMGPE
jgi:hypothetical protein